MEEKDSTRLSRRTMLAGAVSVGAFGLSGCLSDDDDDVGDENGVGDESQNDEENGDGNGEEDDDDDGFELADEDEFEEDVRVAIRVGAEIDGETVGFVPDFVGVIPSGTTIGFVWETDGRVIDVIEQPDDGSWDGVPDPQEAGYRHTHTFEESGVYRAEDGEWNEITIEIE